MPTALLDRSLLHPLLPLGCRELIVSDRMALVLQVPGLCVLQIFKGRAHVSIRAFMPQSGGQAKVGISREYTQYNRFGIVTSKFQPTKALPQSLSSLPTPVLGGTLA